MSIFTALEPNVGFKEVLNSIGVLFSVWKWKQGRSSGIIEAWFKESCNVKSAYTFDSARSGLFMILKSLGIEKGDEVILQAFTCVAVTNPILWCQATPVYVDIDPGTLNMALDSIKNAVTKKTKVIIVQHTFGYPSQIDGIVEFAKKNHLYVVEDCAHTLGGKYNGQMLGTFGEAAIFSFGRDKAISGVSGGIVISNNDQIGRFLNSHRPQSYPKSIWIFRQLFHPLLTYIVKLTYTFFNFGKVLHFISLKAGLINRASSSEEKESSQKPSHMPGLLANGLGELALFQLKRLKEINEHRKYVEQLYKQYLPHDFSQLHYEVGEHFLLRYPVLAPGTQVRDRALLQAKKNHIFLDSWYATPVAPSEVNLSAAGYGKGSCPNAESIGERIINLPIHIGIHEKEVKKISHILSLNQ